MNTNTATTVLGIAGAIYYAVEPIISSGEINVKKIIIAAIGGLFAYFTNKPNTENDTAGK